MAWDRGEDIEVLRTEVIAEDELLTTTGTFREDSPANADDAVADFVGDENDDNADDAVAVSGNLDDENGDNADDVVAVGPAFGDENDDNADDVVAGGGYAFGDENGDNADDVVAVRSVFGDENGDNADDVVAVRSALGDENGGNPWEEEDLAGSAGIANPADNLAERVPGEIADNVDGFATNMPGDWDGGFDPGEELATYGWNSEERAFDSEEPIALPLREFTDVDDLASGQTDRWDFDQQIEMEDYSPAVDALYLGL